jgi:hypothetical protein
MDRGRAWRIATGAMLLAAGASKSSPPAINDPVNGLLRRAVCGAGDVQ